MTERLNWTTLQSGHQGSRLGCLIQVRVAHHTLTITKEVQPGKSHKTTQLCMALCEYQFLLGFTWCIRISNEALCRASLCSKTLKVQRKFKHSSFKMHLVPLRHSHFRVHFKSKIPWYSDPVGLGWDPEFGMFQKQPRWWGCAEMGTTGF